MSEALVMAVPRDFYCEHAQSKSRVLAVLARPGCHDAVNGVLSCSDPDLAQESAAVLHLALSGRGPGVDAETERLAALLPPPVAASLRQAVDWVAAGAWPVAAHTHRHRPVETGHHDEPDPTTQGSPVPHDSQATRDSKATQDSQARTPADARLADLPGPVLRVMSMIEMHVHDPERLLAWASATDWVPADAQELPDDDPRDLLGAAMWLIDNAATPPGADLITASSTGELLRAERGDELADWSAKPIIADFGTGWRPTAYVGEDLDADMADQLPGFAALFPINDDEDGWNLTPRTATALHTALSVLADWAYDDIEEHGDKAVSADAGSQWYLFNELPRISWQQDAAWRRCVARAADDLCHDIEHGQWPLPRCNAEELMLHLAIDYAEDMVNDGFGVDDGFGFTDLDLPEHEDDYDWAMCSEVLFQDHDILLLNEAWADGIEDPDTDINQHMRIGDLRPDHWLTTFNNMKPREPARGYRR